MKWMFPLALALAVAAGCNDVTPNNNPRDAGRDPGPTYDGGVTEPFDAMPTYDAVLPDAPPPTGSRAQSGTAAGRVSGGSFQLDFQIGQAVDQRPMTGGGKALEGAAVIKR